MTTPQNQYGAEEAVLNLAKMLGVNIEIKDGQGGSEKPEKKEKKKRPPKKLPKTINDEQFNKIIKAISPRYNTGKRNRAILGVMYRAALRVQEVCNLTPADVNLETGTITVQNGKNSKDRKVPIGAQLIESLKIWEAVRPESIYFFCTNQGGKIDKRYIRAMLERKSKQAEVYLQDRENRKAINPHCMRHSCATNWLNDSLSIRDVQELLGHSTLNTTMRYTHVSMKELDKKIKALG